MRDPKRRAKSMAILWMKKCYDLGITAGEIVAESAVTTSAVTTVTTKEKEKGKEGNSPHTPLKEKREKEEKIITAPPARAMPAVVDMTRPPTLDELLHFAHSRGCNDDAFCRKWFERMENELFWRHPKTGQFFNHWVAYFMSCYRLRDCGSSASAVVKPRRGVSQTANVHSKEVGRW